MASLQASFTVEWVDGFPLGRLWIPLSQAADWINFLVTPHYQVEIIAAEQDAEVLSICFEASEGLYSYLEGRLQGQSASLRAA